MRALTINDETRAKVARVVAHAEQHHYFPGAPTPGDDPRFVAMLDTYRAVFTFTHSDRAIWRHLSVSVPSRKFPSPIAAFMIADLFGFTGYNEHMGEAYPPDWAINVNEAEHCVVIAQMVKSEGPTH